MPRSSDQVLALAPDASSATAGKGQASLKKWITLGGRPDLSALWGEVQGSGSKPYQVVVDDTEPAFKCTCPSRKFPCKHGLGLLLLLASSSSNFTLGEPPAFAADWLGKRAAKAVKASAPPVVLPPEEQAALEIKQAQQKNKRDQSRDNKVAAGVEDWKRWVEDQVRTGISGLRQQTSEMWDTRAARLIDAQAPGLAQSMFEIASLIFQSPSWEGPVLRHLARWYAIVEAWEHRDSLSPEWLADVRRLLGWPDRREDVPASQAILDRWWVLGCDEGMEGRLKVRRTWLRGETTNKIVLVNDHAPTTQSFSSVRRPVGSLIEGHAYLAPGTGGRGWVEGRDVSPPKALPWTVLESFHDVAMLHAQALQASPWYDTTLVAIKARLVMNPEDESSWQLCDALGLGVRWCGSSEQAWTAFSGSVGLPIVWFGLWSANGLMPLSGLLGPDTPNARWASWTNVSALNV